MIKRTVIVYGLSKTAVMVICHEAAPLHVWFAANTEWTTVYAEQQHPTVLFRVPGPASPPEAVDFLGLPIIPYLFSSSGIHSSKGAPEYRGSGQKDYKFQVLCNRKNTSTSIDRK